MYEANYPESLKACYIINGKSSAKKQRHLFLFDKWYKQTLNNWHMTFDMLTWVIRLKKSFCKDLSVISAPTVFAMAFAVVRKFLNEYTLGKIQIFKNDPKKWKKALLENIDANNLPKYYGGDLVDPDGNPKYTTKVGNTDVKVDVSRSLFLWRFRSTKAGKYRSRFIPKT